MTTMAIEILEPTYLQVRMGGLLTRAADIVVRSPDSYAEAGELLREIRTERKTITETFETARAAADEAHKAIVGTIKKYQAPREEAQRIVDGKMKVWRDDEERERRAEEDRLREIARKEEEDRQIAAAAQLEAEGRKQEAEAVLNAQVQAPPVVVPKVVPKLDGVSVRVLWKHRIVNKALVPDEWKIIDDKALAAHARSMKDVARVPGVEFYSEEPTLGKSY